jgi:hypothetical protein
MDLIWQTMTMQCNKTTKQIPTAGRQANFGPQVVIRRHDEGDVVEIEQALVCRRFGEIVLLVRKVIGTVRVHRWTPHKPYLFTPRSTLFDGKRQPRIR